MRLDLGRRVRRAVLNGVFKSVYTVVESIGPTVYRIANPELVLRFCNPVMQSGLLLFTLMLNANNKTVDSLF